MTENQRLKVLQNELGFKSQKDFADALGIKQGSLSDIMRGKDGLGVSDAIKFKLENLYRINRVWIETGEGNKYIANKNGNLHSPPGKEFYNALPQKHKIGGNEFVGVPMYNIPASASLVEMYGDASDVKVIGHLTIPGATKDSFALPVHGHSMYPTLENGSWCVLRPLEDKTDIEWGEIYYIEYGDYRMYKRLLKAEDEDSVILWSDNQSELIMNKPKYSPKTIKKEKIRRLCLLTDILKKPNY